jgi:hypothetical protein
LPKHEVVSVDVAVGVEVAGLGRRPGSGPATRPNLVLGSEMFPANISDDSGKNAAALKPVARKSPAAAQISSPELPPP